jgi:hypothetical protein
MPGNDSGSSPSRLPTSGGLPLGFVALAALVYALSPGGSGRQTAGETTKPAETPSLSKGPLKPLYEFLDVEKGVGDTSGWCGGGAPYKVEFVIATVPDPVDSHLAPSFDRAVDAIQRGLQSTGHTLDRYWIPWRREPQSRWDLSPPPSGAPEALVSVTARSTPGDSHRKIPGTLLFRGPEPGKLFVVFLVGEVPTWGVQREALMAALNAIAESEPQGKPHPCLAKQTQPIRILGPYFSGSTESLRDVLTIWNESRKKMVDIISGSATVDSNLKYLNGPCMSFRATVAPDGLLTYQFARFLRNHLGASLSEDVALFVEGGTSYGSANVNFSEGGRLRPRFTVDFPLHVAQLRAAYEKDAALRAGSAPTRASRHGLELALETGDYPSKDLVRPQDGIAAAGTADLTLGDSIEAIRRERIRFVGIIASDPRDVLFLARRIREAGSDATLFTYGGDILFTHPDNFRFLRGMLVITPYPLFPGNQATTLTGWRRVSFAGASEEGIYNAIRYFAGRRDRLLDYRVPSIDRGENREASRPPIWIMTVGRESFWPVDIAPAYFSWQPVENLSRAYILKSAPIPRRRASEGNQAAEDKPPIPRPPGSTLALIIAEFLLIALASFYWATWRASADSDPKLLSRICRLAPEVARQRFTDWSDDEALRIKRKYLGLLTLLGAAVQAAILATLGWLGLFSGEQVLIRIAVVLGAMVLVGGALALARETLSLVRQTLTEWQSIFGSGVLLGLSVLAIVALDRYAGSLANSSDVELLVFYSRAFDLTSSVSPILPVAFLFVVFALWALCNLERAFLMEVRGPTTDEFDGISGFRNAQAAICRLISDPVERLKFVFVPLLVLAPFYRILFDRLDTIDGSGWGDLLKILILVCYMIVAYSVTLFLALWLRLRSLLQRLSWHPLLEAFQRLPQPLATTPWRMWRTVPSLAGLRVSVSHLRLLANLAPKEPRSAYWVDIEKQSTEAEKLMEEAFKSSSQGFVSTLATQRKLKEQLKAATATILGPLQGVWREWPGARDATAERPKLDGKESLTDTGTWIRRETPKECQLWVRVAEEFLAIRIWAFIRYVFLQMKNLLSFALGGFIFALAAMASYPFHPRRTFMALIWIVGILSIAAIGTVLVSIDRDRVLGAIGKATSGQTWVNREFLTTMTLYVAVPLLTLLATQFPSIGDFIYSVFTPAMKAGR